MSKIYKSVFLLLLLVSCEREVDFPVDQDGRIYVSAMLGQSYDRINVNVSKPAFGVEETGAEDVSLYLEADGRNIQIVRDVEYDSDKDGEVSYLVTDELHPGQKLHLRAEADGLPGINAYTRIPEPLPPVELETGISESYREEDPHQTSTQIRSLREFRIIMDEKYEEGTYFGIQVTRRVMYDTVGTVPYLHWKDYAEKHASEEYDNLFVNAESDEGAGISSAEVELVVDFDGGDLGVMAPVLENGRSVVKVYIKPTEERRVSGSYVGEEICYEIYEYFEYNIKVMRLSPEIYFYLKARYIIDWNEIPVYLGFSPVTYTYTNVEGGLGMFGAVTSYDTGWFKTETL